MGPVLCGLSWRGSSGFWAELSVIHNNGGPGMGMQCLPMSHKVITQANFFIPIALAQ